jgi:hypothetical protein
MSAQQKDDIFALGENLQETQKKLQEFGKAQSAFLTSLVEKNMNFSEGAVSICGQRSFRIRSHITIIFFRTM